MEQPNTFIDNFLPTALFVPVLREKDFLDFFLLERRSSKFLLKRQKPNRLEWAQKN